MRCFDMVWSENNRNRKHSLTPELSRSIAQGGESIFARQKGIGLVLQMSNESGRYMLCFRQQQMDRNGREALWAHCDIAATDPHGMIAANSLLACHNIVVQSGQMSTRNRLVWVHKFAQCTSSLHSKSSRTTAEFASPFSRQTH
jgi:hypothetical protein